LNPPSPPHFDVCRDYAGGFGVAWHTKRVDYGQSMKPCFHPFLPYASAVLSNEGYSYSVLDCQRLKLNKFHTLMNVKNRNPDIIFSLIGLPSLRKDVELLDNIKNFQQAGAARANLIYTTEPTVGNLEISFRVLSRIYLEKPSLQSITQQNP
jgi:hypothetical protein